MKYCTNCGAELNHGAGFCSSCGTPVNGSNNSNQTINQPINTTVNNIQQGKSKILAGLLGIFLGCFGAHNFYLGYNSKAIGQLLLTLIGWILCFTGPVIAAVWGLIEGILLLTGSIDKDANGNPLVD